MDTINNEKIFIILERKAWHFAYIVL
jgi:hypothetical protein